MYYIGTWTLRGITAFLHTHKVREQREAGVPAETAPCNAKARPRRCQLRGFWVEGSPFNARKLLFCGQAKVVERISRNIQRTTTKVGVRRVTFKGSACRVSGSGLRL